MKYKFLLKNILVLIITTLGLAAFSQTNSSPVFVKDFVEVQNGIADLLQIPEDARKDFDNNVVCLVEIKARGFDEDVLKRIKIHTSNVPTTHKYYNIEIRLRNKGQSWRQQTST